MAKKNVLIIGAGGVAQVTAHKVAQWAAEFGDLHIASRTQAKADAIIDSLRAKGHQMPFASHALDGMDPDAVAGLIGQIDAGIVINVGTAFINMTVLEGCIRAGAAYIDTAIHEDPAKVCETPPWYGNYEWKRREDVASAGITAVLGAGFDPGVVNAYARLAED
ncbi:MAG: saccharopine dehydrogenase NADP-binding domain-containing protein, partial [Paracoccus sp. (in: a-proteobacteria)]